MTAPPISSATTSLLAVTQAARAALLAYANPQGAMATDILFPDVNQGCYIGRAPDNPTYPFAVMRLNTRNAGRNHGLRLDGSLEIQIYGKPYTQQENVNAVADLFEQAMLLWIGNAAGQGLVFSHGTQRDQLPPGPAPIDSEVVTVRLLYTLAIWPQYLTSIATSPLL